MPGLDIADSWLQVETRIAGGTADNNYGLVCRYRDMDHFYAFLISGDGYYAIVKVMENADYQILSGDGMHLLPSEIIQTELGATNEIRAECEGDRLTLSVNGKQLASVKDQEYTLGDIGFIASSYQGAPTEVRFDNLLVLRPFGTEEETE